MHRQTNRRPDPPPHDNEDREHQDRGYNDRGNYHRANRYQEQDRDAQFYRSIAKAPKMDFPRFDGTHPEEWLRMTDKYFAMVYVPEDAKFDYAQMYITGKADTWLRNSGVLDEGLTWKQFTEVVVQRFTESSSYEAVEEFNCIKQGLSSVHDYTDRFEDKRSNYKKQNPDTKEAYYIKCYINGLRAEIKHYMKPLKPATLYEAVEYARDMEMASQATAQSHNRRLNAVNTNRNSYNSQFASKPVTTTEGAVTKKEPDKPKPKFEAKYNEPGTCKYCGQKWFFGHRCQQYKRLNMMATEEDQTQEEETFHDTEQTVDTMEPPESSPTVHNHMMQISLQAAKGNSSTNTFTLRINIGGKRALALVDTGSTHTFMDLKFSTKIHCHTISTLEKVLVAGGGELHTGSHTTDMEYTVQGHKFRNAFKIIPLKGYDIILGGDWMLTHSPVTFDYEKRHVKIKREGKEKLFVSKKA